MEATRKAYELGLTSTIGFIAVPASRTSTAAISRVNEYNRDANAPSLVHDKLRQFVERPIAYLPAHLSTESRCSLANTGEVFERDCLSRYKCRLDDCFTDVVVDPLRETADLTANLFERAPCTATTIALKSTTVLSTALTAVRNAIAGITVAVAVHSYVDDAEVDAENAVNLDQWRVGNANGRKQVERSVDERKVAFALTEGQQSALIVATDKLDFLAAVDGPNRDFAPIDVPVQYPVVEGNRAECLKESLRLAVQFIGIGDLADAADHNLSRKSRDCAHGGILRAVKRKLAEGLVFPGPRRQAVANRVRGFHRAAERGGSFQIRNKFHLGNKFQRIDIVPAKTSGCQSWINPKGETRLTPC